MIQFMQIFR